MPLSFLSFLSFFFLFLFFYVVTFACIRAVIEAPQKKRRPCVCVCVRKSWRECKGGCFRANDAPRTNLGIKSFLKLHK